jgi:FKBP-type peptidyl-prolyl cis-trans isomerase FklB
MEKNNFMKFKSIALALGLLCGFSSTVWSQDKQAFKDETDKVSYSFGINIGNNLKRDSVTINPDLVTAGIKDALAGKPQLTDEEVRSTLAAFSEKLRSKQIEKAKEAGERNKVEGPKFLAENKKKEGVKTTPSGLQYKVIKEGTGPMPKATDEVTVHYRGTIIDGTEFDSSYKRGQPATFNVSGVIPGWTEALQMMKVGSHWQLYIPSELAYKDQQKSAQITPNSVLIFDVELLNIGGAPVPPQPK